MKNLGIAIILGLVISLLLGYAVPGLGKGGIGIVGGVCLFVIGRALKIL